MRMQRAVSSPAMRLHSAYVSRGPIMHGSVNRYTCVLTLARCAPMAAPLSQRQHAEAQGVRAQGRGECSERSSEQHTSRTHDVPHAFVSRFWQCCPYTDGVHTPCGGNFGTAAIWYCSFCSQSASSLDGCDIHRVLFVSVIARYWFLCLWPPSVRRIWGATCSLTCCRRRARS